MILRRLFLGLLGTAPLMVAEKPREHIEMPPPVLRRRQRPEELDRLEKLYSKFRPSIRYRRVYDRHTNAYMLEEFVNLRSVREHIRVRWSYDKERKHRHERILLGEQISKLREMIPELNGIEFWLEDDDLDGDYFRK